MGEFPCEPFLTLMGFFLSLVVLFYAFYVVGMRRRLNRSELSLALTLEELALERRTTHHLESELESLRDSVHREMASRREYSTHLVESIDRLSGCVDEIDVLFSLLREAIEMARNAAVSTRSDYEGEVGNDHRPDC